MIRSSLAALLCSCIAPALAFGECVTGSDPLGLADCSSVLFIDGSNSDCNTFAGIVAADARTRDTALNPNTPWCSLRGLNESIPDEKLHTLDTVYIVDGEYSHFIDNGGALPIADGATPRVRIKTSGVTITRYPEPPDGNDEVVIRAGSYDFGYFLSFTGSDITLENLTFLGNISVPPDPTPADGIPADVTTAGLELPGDPTTPCEAPIGTDQRLYMKWFLSFGGASGGRSSGHTLHNIHLDDFEGLNDEGYCYRFSHADNQKLPWGGGLNFSSVDNVTLKDSFIGCTSSPELMAPAYHNTLNADGLKMDFTSDFVVSGNEFSHCGHASSISQ